RGPALVVKHRRGVDDGVIAGAILGPRASRPPFFTLPNPPPQAGEGTGPSQGIGVPVCGPGTRIARTDEMTDPGNAECIRETQHVFQAVGARLRRYAAPQHKPPQRASGAAID